MKLLSINKILLASCASFSITNVYADLDPLCYDNIRTDYYSGEEVGDEKPIKIDVKFQNPLTAGGIVTFDLSNSKVPSEQMQTPTPTLNPGFVAISSTAHTYTYKVPSQAGDYNGRFSAIDSHCGFSKNLSQFRIPVT